MFSQSDIANCCPFFSANLPVATDRFAKVSENRAQGFRRKLYVENLYDFPADDLTVGSPIVWIDMGKAHSRIGLDFGRQLSVCPPPRENAGQLHGISTLKSPPPAAYRLRVNLERLPQIPRINICVIQRRHHQLVLRMLAIIRECLKQLAALEQQ